MLGICNICGYYWFLNWFRNIFGFNYTFENIYENINNLKIDYKVYTTLSRTKVQPIMTAAGTSALDALLTRAKFWDTVYKQGL